MFFQREVIKCKTLLSEERKKEVIEVTSQSKRLCLETWRLFADALWIPFISLIIYHYFSFYLYTWIYLLLSGWISFKHQPSLHCAANHRHRARWLIARPFLTRTWQKAALILESGNVSVVLFTLESIETAWFYMANWDPFLRLLFFVCLAYFCVSGR